MNNLKTKRPNTDYSYTLQTVETHSKKKLKPQVGTSQQQTVFSQLSNLFFSQKIKITDISSKENRLENSNSITKSLSSNYSNTTGRTVVPIGDHGHGMPLPTTHPKKENPLFKYLPTFAEESRFGIIFEGDTQPLVPHYKTGQWIEHSKLGVFIQCDDNVIRRIPNDNLGTMNTSEDPQHFTKSEKSKTTTIIPKSYIVTSCHTDLSYNGHVNQSDFSSGIAYDHCEEKGVICNADLLTVEDKWIILKSRKTQRHLIPQPEYRSCWQTACLMLIKDKTKMTITLPDPSPTRTNLEDLPLFVQTITQNKFNLTQLGKSKVTLKTLLKELIKEKSLIVDIDGHIIVVDKAETENEHTHLFVRDPFHGVELKYEAKTFMMLHPTLTLMKIHETNNSLSHYLLQFIFGSFN
jgi:hypothetical protein